LRAGCFPRVMYIHDETQVKQSPLGIPYSRSDDQSHSYVDLKEHPELASVLPELRDAAPLREFVLALNAASSPYETFGCEKWISDYSHEQLPGFTKRKGCYVDLAFVDKTRCSSPKIYSRILDALREQEKANRTYDVMTVHSEFQPSFCGDNRWWTLSLWMYGIGRNEAEAERWWAECLAYMQRFLLQQSTLSIR
jgi:hypothetical protein